MMDGKESNMEFYWALHFYKSMQSFLTDAVESYIDKLADKQLNKQMENRSKNITSIWWR